MAEQNSLELVRWQDLKVKSEVDIVLEIAQKEGWKDCEVFGHGDMITEPRESMGWKLIPADQYKDSIPPQAVERLHQVINAGIRVRGVIIADDERKEESAHQLEIIPAPVAPVPERPKVSLSFLRPAASWVGNALMGVGHTLGAVILFLGKVLLGLIVIAAVGVAVMAALSLLTGLWWLIPIGLVFLGFRSMVTSNGSNTDSDYSYDPQLVILVDDGSGDTTWVSLFTWYD